MWLGGDTSGKAVARVFLRRTVVTSQPDRLSPPSGASRRRQRHRGSHDRSRSERVAVVGCGYWGSKHARVHTLDEVDEVVHVDGREDRLPPRRAFPGTGFSTLQAALPHVDAVVIATPPSTHAPWRSGARRRQARDGREAAGHHRSPTRAAMVDDGRRARARADGGPHVRVPLRGLEAARHRPARRARRPVLPRHRPAQPRALPARRQRRVGPGAARHLDPQLRPGHARRSASSAGARATRTAASRTSPTCGSTTRTPARRGQHPRQLARPVQGPAGDRGRQRPRWSVFDDLATEERIRVHDKGVRPERRTRRPDPAADVLPVRRRGGAVPASVNEPLVVEDQHFVDCVLTGDDARCTGR